MRNTPIWLQCLNPKAPALLASALWIAHEHDPKVDPKLELREFVNLQQQISNTLPNLPKAELAQPLVQAVLQYGFQPDQPLRPRTALMHQVLRRRKGQPLALAIIILELARGLGIELQAVNFPGHVLLRVPGKNYLIDPCNAQRLHSTGCKDLLQNTGFEPKVRAEYFKTCDDATLILRLSRNLCNLYNHSGELSAALIEAQRIQVLCQPNSSDHVLRANLYRLLECPPAERYELERALLLNDNPDDLFQLSQRMQLLARLKPGEQLH